jgi:hypothetical protein
MNKTFTRKVSFTHTSGLMPTAYFRLNPKTVIRRLAGLALLSVQYGNESCARHPADRIRIGFVFSARNFERKTTCSVGVLPANPSLTRETLDLDLVPVPFGLGEIVRRL